MAPTGIPTDVVTGQPARHARLQRVLLTAWSRSAGAIFGGRAAAVAPATAAVPCDLYKIAETIIATWAIFLLFQGYAMLRPASFGY
ncbi:hypothetical protein GCM10011321_06670 [Youhaiella tibetensis]|nr:hypothetical protein GCM10011321_06670 [Youhaiella tibetensis]